MKNALTLLAMAALLAACGAQTAEAPAADKAVDHAAMGHDMGAMSTPAGDLTEAQAAYKAVNDTMHAEMMDIPADADLAFMQGMLAHHKGAVAMSEVALKYAKDEQARDLATRVIAAQKAEIAEMETWLKARGAQ